MSFLSWLKRPAKEPKELDSSSEQSLPDDENDEKQEYFFKFVMVGGDGGHIEGKTCLCWRFCEGVCLCYFHSHLTQIL